MVTCVRNPVPGNETPTWDDQERRKRWQKAREGVMYAGVVSVIDHSKHILNVDFDDGDKTIGVSFNLVKFPDGQFFDESMSMEHRRSSTKLRKLTPSKGGYKWCHGGVQRIRFTEATYDVQPLPKNDPFQHLRVEDQRAVSKTNGLGACFPQGRYQPS